MRRFVAVAAWLAAACDDAPRAPTAPADPPEPVRDQAEYTALCASILGELPPLACADGDPVPVTVTDATGIRAVASVAELESGFRCDRPSGLSRCVPGSRARVGQTSAGVPFVFVCRKYAEHPDDPERYDQLGIVAHDPGTGATCFWSTPDDGLARRDPIPAPGSDADLAWSAERSFWYTLPELAAAPCTDCHDNDPWIATPWIAQVAGLPGDPLGDYTLVAGDALGWTLPPRLVAPEAAACTTCHRLAAGRSCSLALDAAGVKTGEMPVSATFTAWPASHWMDDFDATALALRYESESAWNEVYGGAVAAITQCCAEPDDPDCWEVAGR